MLKCLITVHTSWYSPKRVRYCRISLCCMPRVRGERKKDIGTMWYPPLSAQITFPVEQKPLLVLINNRCFACRQLLPETKRKYWLILRKLSWLVQGKPTWSTSFLAPLPLLTPHPPPPWHLQPFAYLVPKVYSHFLKLLMKGGCHRGLKWQLSHILFTNMMLTTLLILAVCRTSVTELCNKPHSP